MTKVSIFKPDGTIFKTIENATAFTFQPSYVVVNIQEGPNKGTALFTTLPVLIEQTQGK